MTRTLQISAHSFFNITKMNSLNKSSVIYKWRFFCLIFFLIRPHILYFSLNYSIVYLEQVSGHMIGLIYDNNNKRVCDYFYFFKKNKI